MSRLLFSLHKSMLVAWWIVRRVDHRQPENMTDIELLAGPFPTKEAADAAHAARAGEEGWFQVFDDGTTNSPRTVRLAVPVHEVEEG